jgi:glycosyltransferase involved in cell wall biosynthesis
MPDPVADPVAVTYVVSRWGEPTQTFVRREVAAVRASGATVRVLSLRAPVALDSRDPVADVEVWVLGPWRIARAVVATAVRHPRRVSSLLGSVVRWSAPRNTARQLGACLIGIAAARAPVAEADLVLAHFGWVAASAAWSLTRLTRSDLAIVLHAFELHSARRVDRFTPVPLRAAARVCTISARDQEVVRSRWGIDAEIHHMGVPDEWLDEAPAGPRDPWAIVSVGSLVPKKGHAVLLDALALADPRWRLEVIGEGPERSALLEQSRRRGLADRVRFVGHRDQSAVRAALDRSSVFALACVVAPGGDRDGIPVALMEAMARGTPVVTTRVGGIEELVDGVGVLVDPEDAPAFAAALDGMRDPAQRVRRAESARVRLSQSFRARDGGARVVELAAQARASRPCPGGTAARTRPATDSAEARSAATACRSASRSSAVAARSASSAVISDDAVRVPMSTTGH